MVFAGAPAAACGGPRGCVGLRGACPARSPGRPAAGLQAALGLVAGAAPPRLLTAGPCWGGGCCRGLLAAACALGLAVATAPRSGGAARGRRGHRRTALHAWRNYKPRADKGVYGAAAAWQKLVRSKHKDADHRTAAWRDRKKPGHKYLKTKAQLRNKYAGQAEGESIKSTVYFDPKSALGARRKAEPLRSPSAVNGTRQRWFIMPTVAEQAEKWGFAVPGKRADLEHPPAGSWVCPTCKYLNWPHRTHCNDGACGRPRPLEALALQPGTALDAGGAVLTPFKRVLDPTDAVAARGAAAVRHDAHRAAAASARGGAERGVAVVERWIEQRAAVFCADTSPGLEQVLYRELSRCHGVAGVLAGGQVFFKWPSKRPLALHSASRVFSVFELVARSDVLAMVGNSGSDGTYPALSSFTKAAVQTGLRDALPPALQDVAGGGEGSRPLRFGLQCLHAEGVDAVFGSGARPAVLAQAVRRGVSSALGWTPDDGDSEVQLACFVGTAYVAFGVEVDVEAAVNGFPRAGRFPWSSVPDLGMQAHLAGAMAALALEEATARGRGGEGEAPCVVVDPSCGSGALLLAAARAWPGAPPRLVGRDHGAEGVQRCRAALSELRLDASGVRCPAVGGGWRVEELQDGEADVLLSRLPSRGRSRRGPSITEQAYEEILEEAARVLRPRGRCVLIAERANWLRNAASKGPWKQLAKWQVGGGESTLLLVLERRGLEAPAAEAAGEAAVALAAPGLPAAPAAADGLARRRQPAKRSDDIKAFWAAQGL